MLMTRKTAFNLLKLEEGASEDDIEIAYMRIAMANHPYRKSSSLDTTKIFKEVSIAYKRLQQSADEDWVEQFNSMDLFQSVYGEFSDTEDDDFYIDDEDECCLCTCRHFRCPFCCPICESDDPFLFDPEKYSVMKKKADKMADELMKEEDEEKIKASHKKEKKIKPLQLKCKHKKSKDEVDISSTTKINRKTCDCKEQINNEESTIHLSNNSIKYFQKWVDSNKITDKNRYEVLNTQTEESGFDHSGERKSNSSTAPKTIPNISKKIPIIKKHSTKNDPKNFPNLMVQNAETISRQLANQGNQLAGNEEYEEAAKLFTRAINLLNTEFRYYGNRSYCYDRMGRYEQALEDAIIAVKLSPSWAKGYFRKGRAFTGLKKYTEAEKAYEEVLKLDNSCSEAKRQLHEIRLAHLMDMGFDKGQCEQALRKTGCLQFALDELLSAVLIKTNCKEVYVSDDEDSKMFDQVISKNKTQKHQPASTPETECRALWVGNVSNSISEEDLEEHFSQYGRIHSVKALYDRHCAFVNFTSTESAKRAITSAKTIELFGISLSVRYPQKSTLNASLKESVEECRYWRSTGCVFGSLCRYQHIPANKGVDSHMVERTPYQSVSKCR